MGGHGKHGMVLRKLLPFYKKQEKDMLFGEKDIHGGDGPTLVFTETKSTHPITKAFIETCWELGFVNEWALCSRMW